MSSLRRSWPLRGHSSPEFSETWRWKRKPLRNRSTALDDGPMRGARRIGRGRQPMGHSEIGSTTFSENRIRQVKADLS